MEAGAMAEMIEINDETFASEILQSEIPAAVLFKTAGCSHCKKMLPIVEELAGDYAGRVKFAVLDVGEGRKQAIECGILFVPQIIFVKEGKEAGSLRGEASKADVAKQVDALLA
jgi:thioredoxin 1